MSTFHFALWQLAGADNSLHLALFAQAPSSERLEPALVHWVLPAHRHRLAWQTHSLLVEAAGGVPTSAALLDTGLCTLVSGMLPTEEERLRLDFEGKTLRGSYAALRLRPGSSRWLFGPVQYIPDQFRQGPQVAPVWPDASNVSV